MLSKNVENFITYTATEKTVSHIVANFGQSPPSNPKLHSLSLPIADAGHCPHLAAATVYGIIIILLFQSYNFLGYIC